MFVYQWRPYDTSVVFREKEVSMNIGIIYYSQTGHTEDVARELEQVLTSQGHTVTLVKLISELTSNGMPTGKLSQVPPAQSYDLLILGSPVQAFRLALPMLNYLESMDPLNGKPVYVYLTKQLRPFFGGKKALRQLDDGVTAKGSTVSKNAIVQWSAKDQRQQIASLLTSFTAIPTPTAFSAT